MEAMDETFPDIGAMSNEELIETYTREERDVSFRRRILHGKIGAELVNRLRSGRESGDELISGADVEQLTEILAGRVTGKDPAA